MSMKNHRPLFALVASALAGIHVAAQRRDPEIDVSPPELLPSPTMYREPRFGAAPCAHLAQDFALSSPAAALPMDRVDPRSRCACGHDHPHKTLGEIAACCPDDACRCRRFKTPRGAL